MTSLLLKRFKNNYENEIPKKMIANNCDLQKEAIIQFRQQLQDDKDLDISTDDATLLRYLRAKKFNVQQSVALVHRRRQWKIKNQDLLNISFDDCKAAIDNEVINILKQRDAKGRQVFYIKAKNWNPEEISLTNACKAAWYFFEEMLKDEQTQNNGVIIIFDLGDLSLAKIAYFVSFFTFKQCHRMITFFQDAAPIKMKGGYFISSPFIVASTFHAVKYLLKKKLRDRVVVDSSGPQILHENMGKENLPHCLGGDIPDENSFDKEIIKAVYSQHKF